MLLNKWMNCTFKFGQTSQCTLISLLHDQLSWRFIDIGGVAPSPTPLIGTSMWGRWYFSPFARDKANISSSMFDHHRVWGLFADQDNSASLVPSYSSVFFPFHVTFRKLCKGKDKSHIQSVFWGVPVRHLTWTIGFVVTFYYFELLFSTRNHFIWKNMAFYYMTTQHCTNMKRHGIYKITLHPILARRCLFLRVSLARTF